ncbi:MAG TPA: RidA family protein [Gemmatimonadaceae bacterium]|nr:RidA family protein [Gemmatimonadaceae bacterium]
MERRTINPWQWQEKLGYSQAIEVRGGERVLYCAGQTSAGPDGQPRYPGDMRAQLAAAMDNVEAVLRAGGYELKDVVRLNYYTTDIPAFFAGYSAVTDRLATAGILPSGTLLGVARLARPELLVEIEATAIR